MYAASSGAGSSPTTRSAMRSISPGCSAGGTRAESPPRSALLFRSNGQAMPSRPFVTVRLSASWWLRFESVPLARQPYGALHLLGRDLLRLRDGGDPAAA